MNQSLLRFLILSSDKDRQAGHYQKFMLINVNHIISIKPIGIMADNEVVPGYWIRTSHGKKYRALSIPPELEILFGKDNEPLLRQQVALEDENHNASLT